MNQMLTG